MFSVQIQTQPFQLAKEEALMNQKLANYGASVAFQGCVRGHDQQVSLDYLFLEHYPGVTEAEMMRVLDLAKTRWNICYARVIHRVGQLFVGEPIVLVLTAALHRKEAFAANEFVMDYLKMEAPFWKKEFFSNGDASWVDAKQSDAAAQARWQQ